ncbi:MAG: TIGR03067 domain-containing protein [Acidobacteria bacterium]|nr:TIGR03067 domain-containing protein [Acidobacteriota bacterium]
MPQDLDRLQGVWLVTSLELDGQTMPESLHAQARITITGNRFQTTGMGPVYEGTLRLDATQSPAHLDMHFNAGPETGNTNLGIYELNGATWRLCLATRGKTRPSAFATAPSTGFALETLTRDSANPTPQPKAPPSARSAARTTPSSSALDGHWTMVSGIVDGKPMDPTMAQLVKRLTRDGHTTITAGPQIMLEFDFTTDPATTPKSINYSHTAGPIKGKTQLGIYECDGSQLRVHMAAVGAPRPTSFTAPPEGRFSLTFWKRD